NRTIPLPTLHQQHSPRHEVPFGAVRGLLDPIVGDRPEHSSRSKLREVLLESSWNSPATDKEPELHVAVKSRRGEVGARDKCHLAVDDDCLRMEHTLRPPFAAELGRPLE